MKKLETDRLVLRDWQVDDAVDCLVLWSNPEITHAGWTMKNSMEEINAAMHVWQQEQDSWAITLKDSGSVIGAIFLSDINRHSRYRELEYAIIEDQWNRGYATEAVNAVLKHAFMEMELHIVAAACYDYNKRSIRVIEKCGFTYEGTLRKYSRNQSDSVRYSMLRDEWEQLHG